MKNRNTYFLPKKLQSISLVFSKVFALLVATCLINLLSHTHVQAKEEVAFSKNQTDQIFTLIACRYLVLDRIPNQL